ncbi:STAG domain protein [Dictyocaulus viviparus]|uniref:STAG domain protein n=1 Tax=Dictyocaulus viviparus TaxID=29172 RepID=A0A0D8Y3A0_DICVI|nr:STAG domain protein [Dictyocaulus viviparus]
MMEDTQMIDVSESPNRMTTRGQRINYAELNSSSSIGFNSSSNQYNDTSENSTNDGVFRSPTASTRGRKRRPTHEDVSALSSWNVPKRGRPRGAGITRGPRIGTRRPVLGEQQLHNAVEIDETGLFGAVKTGRNLEQTIDEWIEEYERNPDAALVKLQQFFISCCGCKGTINAHMLSTMEYSDIIRRMTEDFDEDSGDYPLILTGMQWKKFRNNLHSMLYVWIDKCKSSLIFDQRMMDSVIQLLTGLADSQVRAFRHTATFAELSLFAAMKISSALVDVTLELVSVKERNAKQLEAEKARLKQSSGTNEKLDVLIQKKNEIEERTDDVRQMLQYIFKSVFVHRYRDVLPDTRSICITELGNWMLVYPDHFLEDSYLKYIGWSLYDKIPDVRLKCVSALLPLYDKQDVLVKLELFTNKFKDRLVSMVLDKDYEVAMKTCQLMTSIYRVFSNLLQLKDCVPIYELVYSNHRGLAVAAGEFLNTKVSNVLFSHIIEANSVVIKDVAVFQHTHRNRSSSVAGSSRSGMGDNAKLIQDLIQFFIEGECHDHATYLVDALIDTNPMIKDWQTMVDLLLSDDVESTESQLIEVLVCSVRQSATGEPPVGRSVVKRGAPSTKENRTLVEDRTRLSEVLIPALPRLLQKFIADRDKVANLITIPLNFQLDMYMAGRLENHLAELMRVIDMVVEKHADEEMLNTVAEMITYFSTNTSVAQHTETYKLKLIDGLALQLRHTVQRCMNEEQWDEEDEAAMLAAFRKITAFSSHIDLKKWDLWDVVLHVLNNHDDRAPRDVIDKSIWFLFMQLNWDLLRLIRDQEPNKIEAVNKLRKRRDQFLHDINIILSEGASGVELAFQCLNDSLIMFNKELSTHGSHLEPLIVHLDNEFILKMQSFVNDNVFTPLSEDTRLDQQQQVELMHMKRSLLSQYCKMVLHGVFPVGDAAFVLRYYCEFYSDFGDILKQLLYKCRDLNFVACAKAVIRALTDVYESIRMKTGQESVDPLSDDFHQLRDLAKRFAVAFGNDHVKNREAVAVVHRDGIQFALKGFDPSRRANGNKPINITFLEVIIEFSAKLIRQDKAAVMRYLERHGPSALPSSKDSTWEPYLLYRNSLAEKHLDDVSSVRSFSTAYTVRGRGRGRGRGRSTPTPSET